MTVSQQCESWDWDSVHPGPDICQQIVSTFARQCPRCGQNLLVDGVCQHYIRVATRKFQFQFSCVANSLQAVGTLLRMHAYSTRRLRTLVAQALSLVKSLSIRDLCSWFLSPQVLNSVVFIITCQVCAFRLLTRSSEQNLQNWTLSASLQLGGCNSLADNVQPDTALARCSPRRHRIL